MLKYIQSKLQHFKVLRTVFSFLRTEKREKRDRPTDRKTNVLRNKETVLSYQFATARAFTRFFAVSARLSSLLVLALQQECRKHVE